MENYRWDWWHVDEPYIRNADDEVICTVNYPFKGASEDANLISAAPDMMKALEKFIETKAEFHNGVAELNPSDYFYLKEISYDAIRKAKGEL